MTSQTTKLAPPEPLSINVTWHMAKISELLAQGQTFSFELFPPRSAEAAARLEVTLQELEVLHPSFMSITYGAGGSTRHLTNELVGHVLERGNTVPMAHLTCSGHTRDELAAILSSYANEGVQNVLALRGDPPLDNAMERPAGELSRAAELVELARSIADFCIAVAMHPEGHPRQGDANVDRSQQAEKLAQADFGITQFFFRVEDYERLVNDISKRGVDKPILPGIMPPVHKSQLKKMAEMSGSTVPNEIVERLTAAEGDDAEAHRVGVDIATQLCARLLEIGAPGLHFYTMNKSTATREIYKNLKLDSGVTTT
jgi:methylenetetrahydrofolate reductase (NADPH)